jgi:hypothetical protein
VDRLLAGVRLARAAGGRSGASAGAASVFTAGFSIVGQLLDARMAADEALTSVLAALPDTSAWLTSTAAGSAGREAASLTSSDARRAVLASGDNPEVAGHGPAW